MLGRISNPNHRTNGNVACILPTGGRMLNSSLKCNKVDWVKASRGVSQLRLLRGVKLWFKMVS
jgi:hypothetical protein